MFISFKKVKMISQGELLFSLLFESLKRRLKHSVNILNSKISLSSMLWPLTRSYLPSFVFKLKVLVGFSQSFNLHKLMFTSLTSINISVDFYNWFLWIAMWLRNWSWRFNISFKVCHRNFFIFSSLTCLWHLLISFFQDLKLSVGRNPLKPWWVYSSDQVDQIDYLMPDLIRVSAVD